MDANKLLPLIYQNMVQSWYNGYNRSYFTQVCIITNYSICILQTCQVFFQRTKSCLNIYIASYRSDMLLYFSYRYFTLIHMNWPRNIMIIGLSTREGRMIRQKWLKNWFIHNGTCERRIATGLYHTIYEKHERRFSTHLCFMYRS